MGGGSQSKPIWAKSETLFSKITRVKGARDVAQKVEVCIASMKP
jgi:hypothetical protein